MQFLIRRSVLGLLLIGIGSAAGADNFVEAKSWLERMATAMSEQTYQGSFVYVRGQNVETLRITHVKDSEGVRERLVAMSGPQREIVRNPNGVAIRMNQAENTLIDPDLAASIFPDIPIAELESARVGYLFEVGGSARVAGHEGRKVTIYPRDQYRYGYDVWLDEESGLLLRWVLYDDSRRILAKLMFTDLQTGAGVDVSELDSIGSPDEYTRLGDSESGSGAVQEVKEQGPGYSLLNLPPGFRLAVHTRSDENGQVEMEHLVYSDGLASVSVYIDRNSKGGEITEGLSRIGTTNAWSKRAGSRQVTAIGEVPAVTVRTFGRAFVQMLAKLE